MSNINLAGDYLGTYFVPFFVFICIIVVILFTRKKNIAFNCVGFLLIMLSIVMSGISTFADPSIPNNFATSDFYKFFGVVAGMLGTGICAFVAFQNQAK
jgi:hypothetical protein